ncbi:MAG TPA: hypothetical protein PLH93_07890 [Flavobacteriales bacterium]|nr:hypothetical protein [Flavobacteriales bacterium]MCC6400449.1 hypothetical protein [Flavobacteriales bacterium]HQW87090.1 hypothetical protein [Flavobacteriales bacterium]
MSDALTGIEVAPYELWREEGVLRVRLKARTRVELREMRDLLRLAQAIDTGGRMPLVVELSEQVRVVPEARTLLVRCSRLRGRPVAFLATDRSDRLQAEFFLRFNRPSFPFRVCTGPEDAADWVLRWAPVHEPRH